MTDGGPEMEITILPDGTVKSRIRGIKGRGCAKHARWLADILGGPARHEPTEEFYAQEQVTPAQREREQARVQRKG
jgi:hypothetical protein